METIVPHRKRGLQLWFAENLGAFSPRPYLERPAPDIMAFFCRNLLTVLENRMDTELNVTSRAGKNPGAFGAASAS
jgi:hypothetical protein